jgi:putative ABC transport system permease protein
LALATVGLFGVTHFAVNQRSREFGVRTALGATRADLRRLVVAEALRLVAPGILLGVLAALAAAGLLSSAIVAFGQPTPAVYAGTVGVELLVAIAASWSPARRAARADPLTVLRSE